ncbi:MAG: CsbD family protein [Opitutaceae bacterium]|nr:CsbD family protein [Opitutaceae bacterium]
MNKLTIKGDWNIAKGKLKQRWANLTDNDLTFAEGKEDELIGRIQKRTGESRDAVENALKDSCDCGDYGRPLNQSKFNDKSAVRYGEPAKRS